MRTPESDALVAKIIGAHSQSREWVMPDLTKYRKEEESEMSKDQRPTLEVDDPDLPVEMDLGGAKQTFPNAQAFIDWFDPKRHVLEGSLSDEKGTQVKVRERESARRAAAPATKETTRGAVVKKQPPAKKGERAAASAAKKVAKKGTPVSKPRGHGFVRHGVRLGGKEYSSVWQAFQDLHLGTAAECVKFRNILKQEGKATYEKYNKKFIFETFVRK